jgi:hypothetical protein
VVIQFRSNLLYQKFLKKSNRRSPPHRKAAGLRLRLGLA